MPPYFIVIVENCALLFMVVMLLDHFELESLRLPSVARKLLVTLVLSCLGLVIMSRSYEIAPGCYIDSRSILIFVAALYFGVIPTVVLVMVTSFYRYLGGGVGVLPGILSIIWSAVVGRVMHRWYAGGLGRIPLVRLLLAAFVVHLILGCSIAVATLLAGAELRQLVGFLFGILPTFTLVAAFLALFMSRRILARERKQMLEEVSEEQRLLSSAIEQSPTSIVITDTNGYIEYVNPKFTEFTGYSSAEVLGVHTRILTSGSLPSSVFVEMWATIRAGKVWRGEFHNKRKDGSEFWEFASIAPFYGTNGEIEKFIAIKEDITERKELLDQLQTERRKLDEANVVKSEFISMVSHELMTPLNHIIGPTEYLIESVDDEEHKELLQFIHRGGARLKRIFRDMICVSEKCFSLQEFKEESVCLQDFLEESRGRWAEGGAAGQLLIRIDKAVPEQVDLRVELVCSVIDQLLENTFKYASDGAIELVVELEPGFLVFHVKDRGPGFPELFKEHLGEPFKQLDMSMTREKHGMGLGLAVCKVMADICGGHIDVVNRPAGGSDCSFYYPLDV